MHTTRIHGSIAMSVLRDDWHVPRAWNTVRGFTGTVSVQVLHVAPSPAEPLHT